MSFIGDFLRTIATVAAIIPGPWQIAARVALLIDGVNQARRARSAANAAAAAAQFAERQQSTRSANDVGRIIYGRDTVAGSLRYWQTTGAKGEFLHLVYVFSAHEVSSVSKVYFNDVSIPFGGAGGWLTSGQFAEVKATEHVRGSRTGAGTITMGQILSSIASVTRTVNGVPTVITTGYSFAGNLVTITDSTVGASFEVDGIYSSNVTTRVRVQLAYGAAGQGAFANLVAESGGKWTAAHQINGCLSMYVRLEYTPEMFGQIGIPEMKVEVAGHKILDPRTGTTVWTENSALIMAHYLKTYCGATTAEVPDAMVIAEANICDQLVTLTVGGTTEKRYTCNAAYSTEMTPRDILSSIGETMASGIPAYAGGQFLIRAGIARTPTLTITNDMVIGGVQIQAETKRNQQVNRVIVAYPEPAKIGVMTEAPPVTNATYLAADGALDLPLNLTIEGCNGQFRAQRLGKIALERARQGLRCDMQCSLDAYDALPGDWVAVTLDRYGWSGKVFEVLSRRFDLEQGLISYSLQENASGVYDWNYGEATTVDLTPNTSLPDPLATPAALVLATPVTGTTALQKMADGSIISRALISWTQTSDVFVLRGGKIEIEWLYSGETVWQIMAPVPGDDVSTYIGPLTDNRAVLVRVRQVNALGRPGLWAYKSFIVVGKTAVPSNVTGLTASTVGGQARITWTRSPDLDYSETEIRIGASWAAATSLGRVAGNEMGWVPYPTEGSYLVWAAHYDTTGNVSAAPASISVAVSARGTILQGGNVLPNANFVGTIGDSYAGVATGWTAFAVGSVTGLVYSREATGAVDNGTWQYIGASNLGGSSSDKAGVVTAAPAPLVMPSGGPVVMSAQVLYGAGVGYFSGDYINSSGAVISSFFKLIPAGPNAWRRVEFFDTAPSGTVSVRFYFWLQQAGSAIGAGIDQVFFSPGDMSLQFSPKAGEIVNGAVDTNQLALSAATDVLNFADYSAFSSTLTPAGSPRTVTRVSGSYTNYSTEVSVIELTVESINCDGTGSTYTITGYPTITIPAIGFSESPTMRKKSSALGDYLNKPIVRLLTVQPGHTVNVSLIYDFSASGGNTTMFDSGAAIRYTVIKR